MQEPRMGWSRICVVVISEGFGLLRLLSSHRSNALSPDPETLNSSVWSIHHLLITVRNSMDSPSNFSRISDNEGTTITFTA